MEDELDQEGMEEKVGEPKKAKRKGDPLKKFIIPGIMVVAAYFLVFHGPGKRFLGEEPAAVQEQQKQHDTVDTEYFEEYVLEDFIYTLYDERGKIRNLSIDVTFMAETKTLEELQRRLGLVKNIIGREIDFMHKNHEYEIKEMLKQESKDTLSVRIMTRVNSYLPDKEKLVKKLYLTIVTM